MICKLAGFNWVMDTSAGILGQRVLKPNGLPAVDGMFGSMPFLWWTELSSPGVQFVRQQFTANNRSPGEQNIAYLVSWGVVDSIIEIYIRTVNAVGSLGRRDWNRHSRDGGEHGLSDSGRSHASQFCRRHARWNAKPDSAYGVCQ